MRSDSSALAWQPSRATSSAASWAAATSRRVWAGRSLESFLEVDDDVVAVGPADDFPDGGCDGEFVCAVAEGNEGAAERDAVDGAGPLTRPRVPNTVAESGSSTQVQVSPSWTHPMVAVNLMSSGPVVEFGMGSPPRSGWRRSREQAHDLADDGELDGPVDLVECGAGRRQALEEDGAGEKHDGQNAHGETEKCTDRRAAPVGGFEEARRRVRHSGVAPQLDQGLCRRKPRRCYDMAMVAAFGVRGEWLTMKR